MSKAIEPKIGVVYECYRSFTDRNGDRARKGQLFIWDGEDNFLDFYSMDKKSGRGVNIFVRKDQFTAHFIPASTNEQPNFKVGDRVVISKDSSWYGQGWENPIDVVGTITGIYDCSGLNIYVKWDNEGYNAYSFEDLVLAEKKSYIDVTEKIEDMMIQAITISSTDQIKELAKVSFLKDQIEAAFPHLFITHKVGNRYKDQNGGRYILTGEHFQVALVNLKTGFIESSTVNVRDYDNITPEEFSKLMSSEYNLTLIKERQ